MRRRCGSTYALCCYPAGCATLLMVCCRYLSQVRQELAMRLLARIYADGPTPSKVNQVRHVPFVGFSY